MTVPTLENSGYRFNLKISSVYIKQLQIKDQINNTIEKCSIFLVYKSKRNGNGDILILTKYLFEKFRPKDLIKFVFKYKTKIYTNLRRFDKKYQTDAKFRKRYSEFIDFMNRSNIKTDKHDQFKGISLWD